MPTQTDANKSSVFFCPERHIRLFKPPAAGTIQSENLIGSTSFILRQRTFYLTDSFDAFCMNWHIIHVQDETDPASIHQPHIRMSQIHLKSCRTSVEDTIELVSSRHQYRKYHIKSSTNIYKKNNNVVFLIECSSKCKI